MAQSSIGERKRYTGWCSCWRHLAKALTLSWSPLLRRHANTRSKSSLVTIVISCCMSLLFMPFAWTLEVPLLAIDEGERGSEEVWREEVCWWHPTDTSEHLPKAYASRYALKFSSFRRFPFYPLSIKSSTWCVQLQQEWDCKRWCASLKWFIWHLTTNQVMSMLRPLWRWFLDVINEEVMPGVY